MQTDTPAPDTQPEGLGAGSRRPRDRRAAQTVLVVDDHPALRRAVQLVLENAGYVVAESDGGEDALRIIRSAPGNVSLLLTDVTMPGLSGPEVAREALLLSPELRVLFMSALPEIVPPAAGFVLGDVNLLRKPFKPDVLLERVRAALAG
jgi:hypothetical protein